MTKEEVRAISIDTVSYTHLDVYKRQLTDCLQLGVKAPIRESGDIEGTPGIVLVNGDKSVSLDKGLIVAKRHVHMTPEDAEKLGVKNHDRCV